MKSRKMPRTHHAWDKWECYKAGFFKNPPTGDAGVAGRQEYKDFFTDLSRFKAGIIAVFNDWPFSCEHNLSNEKMNRIAWLGQAAICRIHGLPSTMASAYSELPQQIRDAADVLAQEWITKWEDKYLAGKKS
jgi:hypothetical protein